MNCSKIEVCQRQNNITSPVKTPTTMSSPTPLSKIQFSALARPQYYCQQKPTHFFTQFLLAHTEQQNRFL
ncbi:unnamed protein product [Paramecium primaurelia]|uniref:Uncharacterized protein n=1 Tax=Paramecium primaurelia TaxID=5886 RepID=A0A8S1Q0B6_PARPR|nr:unnamed protein product [Paramecium primaurelia]